MQFQDRDARLIESIYAYDGVLAGHHIQELFWPNATKRAMEMRLLPLCENGYLSRPTPEHRQTKALPEPVYWLGWRGMLHVASAKGLTVEPPKQQNENQLRIFEKCLRKHGIRWLREPRWSQLKHDLDVVDFRRAVEKAVANLPFLLLERWIPEGDFMSKSDFIEYKFRDADEKVRWAKKGVCPDGFFVIVDKRRQERNLPARARLLLEIDEASYDTKRFGREKGAAGLAYIVSAAYKARFGKNSGRWLVVTTGEERLKHLLKQTHQAVGEGARAFFFTTLEKMRKENVLTAPIWWQAGTKGPLRIIS
jgi:hypothetical protein